MTEAQAKEVAQKFREYGDHVVVDQDARGDYSVTHTINGEPPLTNTFTDFVVWKKYMGYYLPVAEPFRTLPQYTIEQIAAWDHRAISAFSREAVFAAGDLLVDEAHRIGTNLDGEPGKLGPAYGLWAMADKARSNAHWGNMADAREYLKEAISELRSLRRG